MPPCPHSPRRERCLTCYPPFHRSRKRRRIAPVAARGARGALTFDAARVSSPPDFVPLHRSSASPKLPSPVQPVEPALPPPPRLSPATPLGQPPPRHTAQPPHAPPTAHIPPSPPPSHAATAAARPASPLRSLPCTPTRPAEMPEPSGHAPAHACSHAAPGPQPRRPPPAAAFAAGTPPSQAPRIVQDSPRFSPPLAEVSSVRAPVVRPVPFAPRAPPQEPVSSWPSRGALLARRATLFGAPRGFPLAAASVAAGDAARDVPVRKEVARAESGAALEEEAMLSPVSNSAVRDGTEQDRSSGKGVRAGRDGDSRRRGGDVVRGQTEKFVVKATCRYGWESSAHVVSARYGVKFEEFYRLLGDTFSMPVEFAICYVDADGDTVTVSSEGEMEAMLDFVGKHREPDRLRIMMTAPRGGACSPS